MKPRIVIFSAFLTPFRSGAEACVEEVPPLLKDQFDFMIITARLRKDLPKYDQIQGIDVVRVGFGFTFDKWLYSILAPIKAKKYNPQLVHAVLETFAGVAMVLSRFTVPKAKRVLTQQSTNVTLALNIVQKSAFKLWIKPMLRSAHAVTAISGFLIERTKKFGRSDAVLVPNGLWIRDIPQVEKVSGRIIFVGRLREMKAVDILLKAFSKLPDNASLHIVGSGYLELQLKALAQELDIADRVTFVGQLPVQEVYKEMAEAEIFCSLSRHEAFGNVFVEAQAAGCAVVGTTIEAIPEIVTDGESGLLVPMDDIDAAALALEKLLSDSDLRNRIAAAGKESAKQYDWGVVSKKYLEVYEKVLKA